MANVGGMRGLGLTPCTGDFGLSEGCLDELVIGTPPVMEWDLNNITPESATTEQAAPTLDVPTILLIIAGVYFLFSNGGGGHYR